MIPIPVEVKQEPGGVTLRNPFTGHELYVTKDRVVEMVIPKEACEPKSFRVFKVPSKKVPGKKTTLLMCCKRGHWDAQTKRCDRGYFVPHVYVHPVELARELIYEFLSGELSRRRKSAWED
ncbi:MAG: hypothetical protein DRJ03_07335 [Chloroflexi bacterium]|nr:MAG: hypothetical protein DRJ03_07335 [Chloroflexota bacterium]